MSMGNRPAKVSYEIIERYRLVRAFHTCYYTQLGAPISEFAQEFFFVVGDILEGKPIDKSALRYIDCDRVSDFLREDK